MTSLERADDTPRDLYASDGGRDLGEKRNIKLKLPLRQHIRLHALRLYSGQSPSVAVEEALDLYFERVRSEARSATPGPALDPSSPGLGEA